MEFEGINVADEGGGTSDHQEGDFTCKEKGCRGRLKCEESPY